MDKYCNSRSTPYQPATKDCYSDDEEAKGVECRGVDPFDVVRALVTPALVNTSIPGWDISIG